MAGGHHGRTGPNLVGKIARLTEELEKYLFRQNQLRHELKGWVCPGETACAEEEGERVWKLRKSSGNLDLPVLQVCHSGPAGQCEAFETKPEERPPHLAEAISTAYRLTASERITYQWPDSLSPYQWACLRAAEYAKARAYQRENSDPQGQPDGPKPSREHLNHIARLARGR